MKPQRHDRVSGNISLAIVLYAVVATIYMTVDILLAIARVIW